MTPRHAQPDLEVRSFVDEVGTRDRIAVQGSRTRWNRGGPLEPDTRLISAPQGIMAYHPDEMTVRVRAGTLVSELHAELSSSGQRSSLPERGGTVGGALAVGEDDICVLGVGRLRNCVLQLRYVSADGRLITGGGPTVKNVSGFDLPRLMVGSLGTLGLFAETTLRTNPIPPHSAWLMAELAEPFRVREVLFRPSAVLWDGHHTWVKLEGHIPDVNDDRRLLTGLGLFEDVAGPPRLPPHRWSFHPSQLREDLREHSLGAYIASVGTGSVFAERKQPTNPSEPAVTRLSARMKMEFDPTGRLSPGRLPGTP